LIRIKLEFWHSVTGTKDIYLAQLECRYNIPEFTTQIRKLKEARENLKACIKNFTGRLFAAFDEHRKVWLRTVRITAELDCLVSLKKGSEAIGTPSCRPEFVQRDEAFVDFEELRHPGIAMALGQRGGNDFIANDVRMGGDCERIMLLTGPNMAGKSTLMRQTCVGVIMAQLGMYVPASKAKCVLRRVSVVYLTDFW
jgi:DNA mismatch repair protein MSH6